MTGIVWNKEGIDALEAMKQVKSGGATGAPAPPAPGGAGGPPPPPPPPLPNFDQLPPPPPPKGGAPAGDMGAVFEQLNKGESVTAGLRKVDPSQMTHKNPSLRSSGTVPERKGSDSSISRSKSPAPPGKKPKPESMRTKKPPRKELDGNKWIIVRHITSRKTQYLLTYLRKTTTLPLRSLKSRLALLILSLFPAARRPPFASTERPTQSRLTILPGFPSSWTLSCLPLMLSNAPTLLFRSWEACQQSCWIKLMVQPFISARKAWARRYYTANAAALT
jgi:hypothetical protein